MNEFGIRMRTFIVISTILCIGYTSNADECGNTVSSVSPFNIDQYLGDWAQIAVNQAFFDRFVEQAPFCTGANYVINEQGTINVTNFGYTANGTLVETKLIGLPTGSNIGELTVGFPPFFPPTPNYQVFKLRGGKLPFIPYRIAIVYGCQVFQDGPFESFFILARTRKITAIQYLSLLKFAKSQGLDIKALDIIKTDQTNCNDVNNNKTQN